MMRLAMIFGLLLACAPAYATDRALVIGNAAYSDGADVPGAADAGRAALALRSAGFTVIKADDQSAASLRRTLSAFLQSLMPGDRAVILLSGRFAQAPGTAQGWFVASDASAPDLAMIDAQGVSLSVILQIAASAQTDAVVLLGSEFVPSRLGKGLRDGIPEPALPPRVTLVQGDAATIARFAQFELGRRDESLRLMLARTPSLKARGLPAPGAVFRPGVTGAAPVPSTAEEDRIWGLARAAGTVRALESYLSRYPVGRYAALARSELSRVTESPVNQAEAAEAAMTLTPGQRRNIQRGLLSLGHDPRGVDGVFGPGTRTAIRSWQTRNQQPVTGFLTRDQVTTLSAESARRVLELEEEARQRQAEADRADRLYWQSTGQLGDEVGLRAYLNRYPRGLFAAEATRGLRALTPQIDPRDQQSWDRARAQNTSTAYRAYLEDFPEGAFYAEARAALQRAIAAEDGQATAQAAETERALNLSGLPLVLVERRLTDLGFSPGPADGRFDDNTRRAVRLFQAERGLPATGYLTQQTMVALLGG